MNLGQLWVTLILNDANDVDDACNKWTESFLNVACTHVPNKVVTVHPNDSPWYSSDLRTLKQKNVESIS